MGWQGMSAVNAVTDGTMLRRHASAQQLTTDLMIRTGVSPQILANASYTLPVQTHWRVAAPPPHRLAGRTAPVLPVQRSPNLVFRCEMQSGHKHANS
jgi:hypothetical protein